MTVVSRLLAVAVAVALVAGALAVRGDRDGGASDDPGPAATGELAVLCPTELAALCRDALGDRVQPSISGADAIADRLAAEDVATAVLPAAWVDLVDDDRARRGLPALSRSEVLASTPLLLVAFADRAAVLGSACDVPASAVDWSCVGEHVGTPWVDLGGDARWGEVRVGHLPPDTATGLQATAAVVAARTGLPFSLTDLRDGEVASWFRRVERAVSTFSPPGGSHLTGMVTRGPSAANVATVLEAELVGRDLQTTFGPLVVTAPSPLFAVELIVAGTDGDAVARVMAALNTGALSGAGWRTDPAVAPVGAPLADLPPVATTPSGGVLTAVRTAWDDAVG